jgi:hypothetical protein
MTQILTNLFLVVEAVVEALVEAVVQFFGFVD